MYIYFLRMPPISIAKNVYSFLHWIGNEISKEDSETICSPVQLHINQNMTNLCRKNICWLDFIAQLLYIIEWYQCFSNMTYFLVKSTPFSFIMNKFCSIKSLCTEEGYTGLNFSNFSSFPFKVSLHARIFVRISKYGDYSVLHWGYRLTFRLYIFLAFKIISGLSFR